MSDLKLINEEQEVVIGTDGFDAELSIVELDARHEMCFRCCDGGKTQ